MKLFDLNPPMHPHTSKLDTSVLAWAWRSKMFEDYETFEKVRLRKDNLLVGFLFPDGEVHELEMIMRFFLTKDLFLQYYVGRPDEEFLNSIKAIQHQDLTGLTGTVHNVCENLIQLSKICSLHFAVSNWEQNWNDYLEGWLDLVQDEQNGNEMLDDYDAYEFNRITVIGVGLMLGMVRHPYRSKDEITNELELAIGKIIRFVADHDLGPDLQYQKCRDPSRYEMTIDYYPGKEGLQCFFDADYLAELQDEARGIGYEIIEQHCELESWVYDAFQVLAGWSNWNYYKSKCSGLLFRI